MASSSTTTTTTTTSSSSASAFAHAPPSNLQVPVARTATYIAAGRAVESRLPETERVIYGVQRYALHPSVLHRTPRHGATQLTLAHERAPHRSMGRAACRRVWLRVLGAHEPVQLWPRLAAVGCRGDPHQVRLASRRLGTVPPATRLTSSTVQVLRQLCTRGSDASA